MNWNKIDQYIQKADRAALQNIVKVLLKPHASPVFGAVKAVEHEVAALDALKTLGYLDADADEYNLVEGLRVTKAKARALLYNSALRQMGDESEIDSQLRLVVGNCVLCKDGDMFLFEVAQPLTMDRLRQRIRKLGFISDGTFSGSVARIPGDALAALVEALIPLSVVEKKAALKKLQAAGYEEKDLKSIIKKITIAAATAFAGKAAGSLVEQSTNELWPFLCGQIEEIKGKMS